MERLDRTAEQAVGRLLAGQPTSEAKVAFAWKIAAGPTLARAARLRWTADGTLFVTARSDAWRRELLRGQAVILQRVQQLVGPDVVRVVRILSEESHAKREPRSHS